MKKPTTPKKTKRSADSYIFLLDGEHAIADIDWLPTGISDDDIAVVRPTIGYAECGTYFRVSAALMTYIKTAAPSGVKITIWPESFDAWSRIRSDSNTSSLPFRYNDFSRRARARRNEWVRTGLYRKWDAHEIEQLTALASFVQKLTTCKSCGKPRA